MESEHFLKRAAKAPLGWLLRVPGIRQRVIFALRQKYYSELKISVPLGDGMKCPISSREHWCSFSEIFFGSEYEDAWKEIPLPARWLDLGCHAGYFSLYVAWLRKRRGLAADYSALLVDADSRSGAAVGTMIASNDELTGRMVFVRGAISREAGELRFHEREFMASAAVELGGGGTEITVPVLTQERIGQLLPPPFDVVKIDVEGSEFDFLEAYGTILSSTCHLILEWHSWHSGGGGEKQIRKLIDRAGFGVMRELVPGRDVEHDGGPARSGVLLCGKKSPKS